MGFFDNLGDALETTGKFAWEVTKTATKAAAVGTAATALTAATGGVGAVVIGGLVVAEGYCVKKAAEGCDNEVFQKVGDFVKDVGFDTLTGGTFGVLTDSAKVGKKVAEMAKFVEMGKELYEDMLLLPPGVGENVYHDIHKARGKDYDSHCPTCTSFF